jgi:hypothetical protein
VAIVLAVLAAVIGFFIIKQVRDDNGDSSSQAPNTTASTNSTIAGGSLPTATVGSTAPVNVTTGTAVIVANASTQNGVAAKLTTALQAQHFTMQKATNAAAKSDTTHVYYDPAIATAQPVADTLALLMGLSASEPMPSPIPTADGALPADTGVLVLLGNDKAGKSLTDMGGTATTSPPVAETSTTSPTSTT